MQISLCVAEGNDVIHICCSLIFTHRHCAYCCSCNKSQDTRTMCKAHTHTNLYMPTYHIHTWIWAWILPRSDCNEHICKNSKFFFLFIHHYLSPTLAFSPRSFLFCFRLCHFGLLFVLNIFLVYAQHNVTTLQNMPYKQKHGTNGCFPRSIYTV